MTLYLLNYNNYYNRISKHAETISDYSDYILESFENINFNPNDGIRTNHIVNYEGEMPDYCIICNEEDVIMSRWFILESKRIRSMQYELSLLRDVISDWREEVINAPCFIEKATLTASNPLIFNNEDMTFNQIKQSELMVTDDSKTPWYCLYINKDKGQITVNIPETSYTPNIVVSNIDAYEYYTYTENNYIGDYVDDCLIVFQYRNIFDSVLSPATFKFGYNLLNKSLQDPYNTSRLYESATKDLVLAEGAGLVKKSNDTGDSYNYVQGKSYITTMEELAAELNKTTYDLLYNTRSFSGTTGENMLLNENGKIILEESTGKYYRVKTYKSDETLQGSVKITASTSLGLELQRVASVIGQASARWGSPFSLDFKASLWGIVLEELPVTQKTISIPAERRHCQDAPYDIIMIPRDTVTVREINELEYSESDTLPGSCQQFISLAQLSIPKEDLYDVQLLPYCPLTNFVYSPTGPSTLRADLMEKGKDYSFTEGILMVYPESSTFNNYLRGSRYRIDIPSDAVEFKIMNECMMYRLCSPNYNGQFEFSVAKNYGLNGFNISVTYKPFQPYIKVAPVFRGLYGTNFNDARGLICGGDFSLAQLSVEWQSYERNNKNFQVMFDRQIQNMEVNNAIQRKLEKWNVAAGAAGGSMLGGAYGAIAGAAVMGGASLIGGLADIKYNEQLREEALDYTKDLFNYQLGNVQALPYNITKVSAYNADNKIFPFLEVYSCSDTEKEAFRQKMKYNGMSVGVISTINGFIQSKPTYIKGKIIRMENLKDDYHVAQVIADEIYKGVFI